MEHIHTLRKTHALLELIQHKMWNIIFPRLKLKGSWGRFYMDTNKQGSWQRSTNYTIRMSCDCRTKTTAVLLFKELTMRKRSCENWWIQCRKHPRITFSQKILMKKNKIEWCHNVTGLWVVANCKSIFSHLFTDQLLYPVGMEVIMLWKVLAHLNRTWSKVSFIPTAQMLRDKLHTKVQYLKSR